MSGVRIFSGALNKSLTIVRLWGFFFYYRTCRFHLCLFSGERSPSMELINQFIEDYKSKFNYYDMRAAGSKTIRRSSALFWYPRHGHFQGKKSFPFKSQGGTRSRKRGVFYQTLAEIYEDIADFIRRPRLPLLPRRQGESRQSHQYLICRTGNPQFSQRVPNRLHTTSVFPATGPITTVSRCGKSS